MQLNRSAVASVTGADRSSWWEGGEDWAAAALSDPGAPELPYFTAGWPPLTWMRLLHWLSSAPNCGEPFPHLDAVPDGDAVDGELGPLAANESLDCIGTDGLEQGKEGDTGEATEGDHIKAHIL